MSAFVGGMLALLSPCAALLLPAFFASTVGSGPRLLLHGAVFYVGLLLVLVPLGVGAGAVGGLFATHRQAIVLIASVVLIVLGIAQALGFGFDPARLLPGGSELQSQAVSSTGIVKTLLLGASSGIAGFCAGPILGAVLTLAAARGDALGAGVLLAVYGAGMVVPLLLVAAVWRRLSDHRRQLLRGRTFTFLGRELHTTSVITGVLIIGVGVLFWTTNGLVGAPAVLPLDAQAWLQERTAALANPAVDVIAILAVAAAVLTVWTVRRGRQQGGPDERSGDPQLEEIQAEACDEVEQS